MGTSAEQEDQRPIAPPTYHDVSVDSAGVFDPNPRGEDVLASAIFEARTQHAAGTFVSPQTYGYDVGDGTYRNVCRIEVHPNGKPLALLCVGLWVPITTEG